MHFFPPDQTRFFSHRNKIFPRIHLLVLRKQMLLHSNLMQYSCRQYGPYCHRRHIPTLYISLFQFFRFAYLHICIFGHLWPCSAYSGAYLSAPNMVKWDVPKKILQNAVSDAMVLGRGVRYCAQCGCNVLA